MPGAIISMHNVRQGDMVWFVSGLFLTAVVTSETGGSQTPCPGRGGVFQDTQTEE